MNQLRRLFALMALALASTGVGNEQIAGWLSDEAASELFRGVVLNQCNGTFERGQDKLVAFCTLHKSGRFGLEYLVRTNGLEIDFRSLGPFGRQATRGRQLNAEAVQKLKLAVAALPESMVMPPLDRAVVCSFQNGTNWVSRVYDRKDLPKPMAEIMTLIREREENRID